MNYTFLSDFCTIYPIPKIQKKLNTLYPNFDQKYHIPELKWPGIPYTQNPWPSRMYILCCVNVWFQKISIPPPPTEDHWKFRGGVQGQ